MLSAILDAVYRNDKDSETSGTARRPEPLPYPRTGARADQRQARAPIEETVMTHRILVVDDEADIHRPGRVSPAKRGSGCPPRPTARRLKAAREERPDIVILDLMLPGILGL